MAVALTFAGRNSHIFLGSLWHHNIGRISFSASIFTANILLSRSVNMVESIVSLSSLSFTTVKEVYSMSVYSLLVKFIVCLFIGFVSNFRKLLRKYLTFFFKTEWIWWWKCMLRECNFKYRGNEEIWFFTFMCVCFFILVHFTNPPPPHTKPAKIWGEGSNSAESVDSGLNLVPLKCTVYNLVF